MDTNIFGLCASPTQQKVAKKIPRPGDRKDPKVGFRFLPSIRVFQKDTAIWFFLSGSNNVFGWWVIGNFIQMTMSGSFRLGSNR
jgi:hypothetical protein